MHDALVRLLALDRFQDFFEKLRHDSASRPVLERTLTALNVQPVVSSRDLGLVSETRAGGGVG